ncbi:MAG: PQQ-binding-like beta-propeller repeat protein [Gemmataceae bacterium]|nr:PQQ-binding-like beta-propeller repeat protein [Gemmataceae bacterium]
MPVRALAFVGLVAVSAAAAGNDWPRWRGPNNDAISTETGLLKEWPKAGPKVAWTAKDLGSGFGTPSVAGGFIYGMGTRDGKDGVWAVKEADGSPVWFTPVADARKANQNNGPGGTPTVAAGKLYAVTNNGTVARLDAASGKVEWTKNYKKDFGGSDPLWGFNDSALVDGDKVICSPGANKAAMVALKADTGEVAWAADAGTIGGGAGYSSPVKHAVGGVPVYLLVTGETAGLIGVRPDTGKLLFQYQKPKVVFGGVAQIPTPVVKGDKVFVSTAYDGGCAHLRLVPEGREKVAVKEVKSWKGNRQKPDPPMNHHGGMVLIGDHVYFGSGQNNGVPTCVDMNTGDIAWQAPANLPGGAGSAAYLSADGRLYVRYQNGLMALVEPSPKEEGFKVVSSFKLPTPQVPRGTGSESWPHPVIANGRMLIRDQNVLYAYDIKGE